MAGGYERPEESVAPPLRHSRYWAVAAFLLLATSCWLPWWVVAYEDDAGFEYDRVPVPLFDPEAPYTTTWGPAVTGLVAAAVGLWLFLRLAGRSHAYEPADWVRDLALQAASLAAALASTLLWPAGVPFFWGGRTLQVPGEEAAFTETAMPGLGWWLALLSVLALGAAWATARRARRPDRSTDSP